MQTTIKIIEIFLLGVIGGAVPGPILTATFTQVLSKGFKSSLKVVMRALIAESVLAFLILIIFASIDIPTVYFHIISFGGVAVLVWLATQVWKINRIDNDKKEIFSFYKIFLLTILNGGFWIFWIVVCVPKAFLLKQSITGGHYVFLLVFELGWLLMTILLAFVFSRFRPILMEKKLVSGMFKIFSLILIFFAMMTAYVSIRFLIGYF